MNTKLHAIADAKGRPIGFYMSAGQVSDYTGAAALLGSLATTLDGGFVVGARSFPGNPYNGHTLVSALEQVAILTDQVPTLAVVDCGYRSHGVETTQGPDQRHETWHL
jgi:hypothetical protein